MEIASISPASCISMPVSSAVTAEIIHKPGVELPTNNSQASIPLPIIKESHTNLEEILSAVPGSHQLQPRTTDTQPAMANTPDEAEGPGAPTIHSDMPTMKRRKVRKGTRSCWECKRRKISCVFASSQDATCAGCQRRRVPCVSQEIPQNFAPLTARANRHDQLDGRIARLEDLLREAFASKQFGSINQTEVQRHSNSSVTKARLNDPSPPPVRALLTPAVVSTPDTDDDPRVDISTKLTFIRASGTILLLQSYRSSHRLPQVYHQVKSYQSKPMPRPQLFVTYSQLFQLEKMPRFFSRRAPDPLSTPIWSTLRRIAS